MADSEWVIVGGKNKLRKRDQQAASLSNATANKPSQEGMAPAVHSSPYILRRPGCLLCPVKVDMFLATVQMTTMTCLAGTRAENQADAKQITGDCPPVSHYLSTLRCCFPVGYCIIMRKNLPPVGLMTCASLFLHFRGNRRGKGKQQTSNWQQEALGDARYGRMMPAVLPRTRAKLDA